jgi:DNA-binding response OmpR family regulator
MTGGPTRNDTRSPVALPQEILEEAHGTGYARAKSIEMRASCDYTRQQVAKGVCVLFVDDRRSAAAALKVLFAQQEPTWHLDWVRTAEEGVRLALSGRYTVALIDENLEHPISGLDACRELRRCGSTAVLLVYAADDSEAARAAALAAGADGFISKHLDAREVIARIKEPMMHAPQRLVWQCDELRLDLATMEVSASGRLIEVTKAEWRLLLCLTSHAGPVAPERLCEASGIQPGDQFKSLQSHIKRLREKLGEGAGDLIQSRYAKGYELVRPRWNGFQPKCGETSEA